jgi:hypothetical protein
MATPADAVRDTFPSPARRARRLALASGAGLLSVAGLVATPVAAFAGPGGNAGDVWVDTATSPAGPGHEMDPQLDCSTINLWGSGLTDAGGTFQVSSVTPTGSGTVVYSGSWSTAGGPGTPIATIDGGALVADLPAGTAAQPQQGYHFQVVVSQDPAKSKTFWLNGSGCPAPGSAGSGGLGNGGYYF